MPTNTLTDAKCRAAKPGDKPIKMFDGGGLHLFVTTKGAKVWRLAYRIDGKPKTISFGPYPEVSLAEARQKRDYAKAKLRDGINPMDERARPAATMTLAGASEAYWEGRSDLSEAYRNNARRGIEMHLFPSLGQMDIGAVSREDLMVALRRMDAAGLHVYVRKVRGWISQVFDWAMENGYAANNPALSIRTERAFGKARVQHFPALELRDVHAFMDRLSLEKELQSVLACKMLAYTWVRTTELRMMEWQELDEREALWLIPAGKMKRGKDLLVPLSTQALAIIQTMRDRARQGQRFVFPHDRRLDQPMSENAVLYLIGRIGYKGRMTGHGWRSVGSTWANERGYTPDAIERQLAHAPENKIRSVYNRAEYLPERRGMLQAWADWVDLYKTDPGVAQG